MLPQLFDLVTNYKPDLIFADGEWEQSRYVSLFSTQTFKSWERKLNLTPINKQYLLEFHILLSLVV